MRESLPSFPMTRSQTLEDGSGEHLLPLYGISTNRYDPNDPDSEIPLTELRINDNDGHATYQGGSAKMRFWSIFHRIQTRLTQGFHRGAESRKACLQCRQGSTRSQKWLRRFIKLGAGLLIALYLDLCLISSSSALILVQWVVPTGCYMCQCFRNYSPWRGSSNNPLLGPDKPDR